MAASFWTQNYWLPTVIVALIIGAYYYYENKRRFWASLGLKGVIPFPLVGHFYTMFMVDKLQAEKARLKTYGKIYGTYLSGKARILVADPEILRQICIKDFDTFTNHQPLTFGNKYQRMFLVWLQDTHWKRVRSLMTPTFTSGKIKKMFRFLEGCADDLVNLFDELLAKGESKGERRKKGAIVNLKEVFDMFTLDGIATCCYGLKLKRESNNLNLKATATRDDFMRSVLRMFEFSYIRIFFLFVMPHSLLKMFNFKMTSEKSFEPLVQRVNELIKKRQQAPQKYDDLLQSLIDAKEGDKLELNDMDQAENHHAGLTHESLIKDQDKMLESVRKQNKSIGGPIKYQLSDMDTMAEAIFILAAGLETTSTLLTHCVYALSFHQKIQDRLFDELLKISQYNPDEDTYKFQYETLTSCEYLDAVISESLRIMPPAPHTDRVASRDYYIEKYDVHVPKGFAVLLGLYAVQNDPENWWKPEKFDPERFLPGNREKIVPGSYAPFSMGPRHCIGMRFSLAEAKIGLAKSIMKFKFLPVTGNKFPPPAAVRPGLIGIKNPTVQLLRRCNS